MTIIKAFICILAIVTICYLLIKNQKEKIFPKPVRAVEALGTITPGTNNAKKDYISFRLMSGSKPKVWEFEMNNKITIIGRALDNFKGEESIQRDLHFSREHLAVQKDKNGVVRFTALKGMENPVYVLSGNKTRTETGHFILEPGTHTLKMGETVFEVFFKGEWAAATNCSGTKECYNKSYVNSNVDAGKTRIWGI